MNLKQMLAVIGAAGLMCSVAMAQPGGGGMGGGMGGGRGGFGGGDFDPAQMQQQMMDRYREQMDVKDDAEWKIISERLQKVMDARREAQAGGGRGMGMMGGRRGQGGEEGGRGGRGGRGQASPELEALQAAIQNNAPADQIKAALEKYRKVRAEKQAALEKTQAELKKVLSVKQEAVCVANGMLN